MFCFVLLILYQSVGCQAILVHLTFEQIGKVETFKSTLFVCLFLYFLLVLFILLFLRCVFLFAFSLTDSLVIILIK